ncbi:TPA: glycosyltransferase family 2 protein, partial [Clostridioides difficile]|nr:glycosyltransferase family 2 protein [Clostridioides difficile]
MFMINIVIPNYNGYKLLKNCLDSLKNQTYSNFSIIVVDNASDDSSYNWLNNYENVTLKKLDKNYGFSKAVNEGIKLSNSKYVVLLNNDTVVPENWLETLLGEIEKDESIFSVCSKMIRYNEKDKIDDAGDEYSILGWAYKIGDGKNISSFRKSKYVFSSCAGAAIYRNSIFDEIGYFDEDFFAYMEDIDISYRAKIYGYKNRYCSEAKIFHIGSATSGSKYNSFKVRLAARNNVYVPYKNMPFLQLIINMPFLIIG